MGIDEIRAEQARSNLERFRDESGLSVQKVSDLSGITLKMYKRYEDGETRIPAAALKALADAFGRSMDDFYAADPPPADDTARPTFFLRTRDDVEIDADLYAELVKHVEEANSEKMKRLRATKKKLGSARDNAKKAKKAKAGKSGLKPVD